MRPALVPPKPQSQPLQLNDGPEKLAIFGTRRARRGAELKVMSAVEHKHPGHFVDSQGRLRERIHQAGDDDGDDWDYETARCFCRAVSSCLFPRKLCV